MGDTLVLVHERKTEKSGTKLTTLYVVRLQCGVLCPQSRKRGRRAKSWDNNQLNVCVIGMRKKPEMPRSYPKMRPPVAATRQARITCIVVLPSYSLIGSTPLLPTPPSSSVIFPPALPEQPFSSKSVECNLTQPSLSLLSCSKSKPKL